MTTAVDAPARRPWGVGAAVIALTLVGAGLRLWLADERYPETGDPTFSYGYRALLISTGDLRGVFLLGHPPGYPLLLAVARLATFNALSPYQAGVAVSVLAYGLLTFVVDRLIRDRVRFPATRILVASFLALYEGCFIFQIAPLTEPVYLLILMVALWWVDRPTLRFAHWLGLGVLLGAGVVTRLEAIAPAVGLSGYLLWRQSSKDASAWKRPAATIVLGFAIASGWMFANVEYLQATGGTQLDSSTVPPARSWIGMVPRLAAVAYSACVDWLPKALLLPYWMLLAIGLAFGGRKPIGNRPSLPAMLLATALPNLAAVAWTIMHKRTGSFLLPMAAIGFGWGIEALARRFRWTSPCAWTTVVAIAVLANALQATRVLAFLGKASPSREQVAYVQASLLRELGAPRPIWSFGAEPEIYCLAEWPIFCPSYRDQKFINLYNHHRGDPAGFVQALREREIELLTFAIAKRTIESGEEPQPYGRHFGEPLRRDLDALRNDPTKFGLELIATAAADRGETTVFVFAVRNR